MAALISITMQEYMLFNRTPNQLGDGKNLDTKKGFADSEQFLALARITLAKILETIEQASSPHIEALNGICSKIINGSFGEFFPASFSNTGQIFAPGQSA